MAATPGIGADAIDSEWLDKMVNKLKAELEAQLKRVASGERH